jgi:hypothetical protein
MARDLHFAYQFSLTNSLEAHMAITPIGGTPIYDGTTSDASKTVITRPNPTPPETINPSGSRRPTNPFVVAHPIRPGTPGPFGPDPVFQQITSNPPTPLQPITTGNPPWRIGPDPKIPSASNPSGDIEPIPVRPSEPDLAEDQGPTSILV